MPPQATVAVRLMMSHLVPALFCVLLCFCRFFMCVIYLNKTCCLAWLREGKDKVPNLAEWGEGGASVREVRSAVVANNIEDLHFGILYLWIVIIMIIIMIITIIMIIIIGS